MFKRFKILQGSHVHGQVTVTKGDTLISGDDLVAIYGREKFEFVEDVCCGDPEACTSKECVTKKDCKPEDKKK